LFVYRFGEVYFKFFLMSRWRNLHVAFFLFFHSELELYVCGWLHYFWRNFIIYIIENWNFNLNVKSILKAYNEVGIYLFAYFLVRGYFFSLWWVCCVWFFVYFEWYLQFFNDCNGVSVPRKLRSGAWVSNSKPKRF